MRILSRNWKVSAIAVLSLSIAMALGILSLSVMNTFLFLPPSAADPSRLVMIYSRSNVKPIEQISYPDFEYFRRNNHVFTDIAAAPNSISVNGDVDENREIKVLSRPVSDNYFAVLGIRPFLGRLFAPGDDQNRAQIAVMTYACWLRLGSDPNIVGKTIVGRTIVGVTPKEFTGSMYGLNGDFLVPLDQAAHPEQFTERDARRLLLLARLKPGVSRQQAQAEMTALSAQLAAAYPKDDRGHAAVLTRATLLPPDAIPTAELACGLLIGLTVLVLLIGCANVANLLLALAVGRRQEAVIKLALGAPRRRLVREFLGESAILCVASGALGYLIAAAVIDRYQNVSIEFPVVGSFTFGLNLHLDWTVAALTVALMLVSIFAAGLAPALYASSPHLSQVLSGEIVVGGTGKNVRRNTLVILQVAICTLVLVGMGLCQRSLENLRHVDPGFAARNLLAVSFYPAHQASEAEARATQKKLRQAIAAIPGVESVAFAMNLPLMGGASIAVQVPELAKTVRVHRNIVGPDYFSTFGIRVLDGRAFAPTDRQGAPEVIVINHRMAEMFWPGESAIGRTVMIGEPGRRAVVIGVVADGKYDDLDEAPQPFFYSSLDQNFLAAVSVIARTKGDPRSWTGAMERAVREVGLRTPARPMTLADWMSMTLLPQRVSAAVVALLSGLGLLLAVAGLFGAIAYSVSERRKELGIRVALGARPGQLIGMVLGQTLRIAGAGVAAGALCGVAITMWLQSKFYGIASVEWSVLLPVSLAMLALSLLVAYLSARPWVRVNPLEAVRHA